MGHILLPVTLLGPHAARYLLKTTAGTSWNSVSMEDNGEKRSAEQAASLFGTPEVENQRRNSGNEKKKNCKIVIGVCFNENTYLSNQIRVDFGPHGDGSFTKMSFFVFVSVGS